VPASAATILSAQQLQTDPGPALEMPAWREDVSRGPEGRRAWPWLGLIVLLAGAYVWWLSLGALRMAGG
jgi:hypothetical protein